MAFLVVVDWGFGLVEGLAELDDCGRGVYLKPSWNLARLLGEEVSSGDFLLLCSGSRMFVAACTTASRQSTSRAAFVWC